MTKIIPGTYQPPEQKKEETMNEEQLRDLFNRIGAERFKKHIRKVDVVTTMAGAKFVREKLITNNYENRKSKIF